MLTTRFPNLVEPYKLAANHEQLEGLMSLERMSRLSEEIGEQEGDCEVRMDFGIDAHGRRFIEGELTAKVQVPCRRCLEPIPVTLESRFLLGMVSSDALAAELPGDYEPVLVESEQLNLLPVVEDELILSVPQVVYHDEAECAVSQDQLASADPDFSDERPENPFSVLRTLKGKT
ncbi:23S rRNA accumulation protein YceD [Halomonas shantousis]